MPFNATYNIFYLHRLTIRLPWDQIDPNYIFEKLLLLNRWQQRYETLWLLFYIEEVCSPKSFSMLDIIIMS